MKTISEQLKDLGLSHGDLCEIEGHEGRAVVLKDLSLKELYVRTEDRIFCISDLWPKVTCGWKAGPSFMHHGLPTIMSIGYTKVYPKPSPKPLPEAVAEVTRNMGPDGSDLAIALLAEVEKMIEAAKLKTEDN